MRIYQRKLQICISILLFAILASCNLPKPVAELSIEEQAGTLAAQTVAAVNTQRPTKTRVPAASPTMPPPSITLTPSISPTPTTSPTPTEKSSLPAKPGLQNYDFFCAWNGVNTDLTITIKWSDKANNESGYRIYRNGTVLIELSENTTTYSDALEVNSGETVSYGIEAYNTTGGSPQATLSATCD